MGSSAALPGEITGLLGRWADGDLGGEERLLLLVYGELSQVARHDVSGEGRDHSLDATALVDEAYVRLAGHESPRFENRAQFFAAAARAMRRILADHARRRAAGTPIPAAQKIPIESAFELGTMPPEQLIELDLALGKLATLDPRMTQIVELRCFLGLSLEQTAATIDVSVVTVSRDWRMGRAWLQRELGHATPADRASLA